MGPYGVPSADGGPVTLLSVLEALVAVAVFLGACVLFAWVSLDK